MEALALERRLEAPDGGRPQTALAGEIEVMNLLRRLKNHGMLGDRRLRKALATANAPAPLTAAPMVLTPPERPPALAVSDSVLEWLGRRSTPAKQSPFVGLPPSPPGVRPADRPAPKGMAMDEVSTAAGGAWGAWASNQLWGEGLFFPGYPYLAELSQRPEYRHMVETLAEQMTRKWIKLNSTGKSDKSTKITKLDAQMKRFNLREAFYKAIELDGFMGMGMLYIDLDGVFDNADELKTPLTTDNEGMLTAAKIGRSKLRGFVPIDPTWVSPNYYNAIDPLKPDFMVPCTWFIMGKEVHASRLLIFRSRELPDILKPAYNFGGLSLSQIAKPYVDNWLRTRQSVSDLLHSFTVFVLKTNMQAYLQNASQMAQRVAAFVWGRDNKGLMMVDKDQEELENISAPLGSLDKLQAQAQEQMASVSQEPLIWLLGITPTGLNNSAEPEIRVFYDRVKAKQEKIVGANLTTALQVIQLSELGSVDPEIGFEFLPLWELDEAGRAAVEKTKADTGAVLVAGGIVAPEEERDRIAADPASSYHGLEGPPPDPPEMSPEGEGDDPANQIDKRGAEGAQTGANSGV